MKMDIAKAIQDAERLLPGVPAPDGREDPRWQAIIKVSEFIRSNPDEVWSFAQRWGAHNDQDLKAAVATCLIEHLLEHHFAKVFPKLEVAVKADRELAATLSLCWKFGQAEESKNAARLSQLIKEVAST